MESLEFRLLGGAEIKRNGRVLSGIRSQKARALLYYLATTNQTHSRTALAGLLWGDLTETHARRNLRKTLTRLRKFMDNHLLITRQTVALLADESIRVDVLQFQKMTTPQTSMDNLQNAAALYQGDFLDGFDVGNAPEFENWVLGQRARMRDRAVICLQQIASNMAEEQKDAEAITYAKQLLEMEPWREESHRLLMTLYARSGQFTSAINQYETCRQILQAELGIEPNRETQDLFRKIQQRHQSSQTAVPTNLPMPATPFLGREKEVDELLADLHNPDVRLLTIVGMGGAGKTRLVLAATSRLADHDFPDGRFFVSFESLHFSDAIDAAATQSTIAVHILISLKIPIAPKEPPLPQLIAHLRWQRLLLILDNVESLLLPEIEPAVLAIVQGILAKAAQVTLLLTSRQPLHLRAEWIFDLAGLPLPAETERAQPASIQLFKETARRLHRHFDIEAEYTAVNKICRLLDGLPLGIELAASLIRQQRCPEIAAHIAQTLEGVATKWQDLPPRHRSLKATFEYTWQLLTEPEKQLLAMLAHMQRGFSDDAAQSVAGDLIQSLDNLVQKSLVKSQANRYSLHEVVLEFAQQKLAAKPAWLRLAATQHTHYFLDQLTRIENRLETGEDYPLCQALRPDLENIRMAWRWAIAQNELDLLDRATRGLMIFFHSMGWLTEGMTLLQEAIITLQAQSKHVILINCLVQQGLLAALGTDLTKATELADLSTHYLETNIQENNNDKVLFLQAQQQFLYGYIAHGNANWAKARAHLTQAAEAFRDLHQAYDEARAYFVIGNGWMGERHWPNVIQTGEKVIALCQASGNVRLEAKVLATMASAYSSDNNLEAAKICREQANQLWTQIEWPIRDEVVWFGMAAEQALDAGYLDEAAAHLQQAMPLVAQSGSMFYEDWYHALQGHLYLQLGDYEQAVTHYEKAKVCATTVEKSPMIAFALVCLCLSYYRGKKIEQLAQSVHALAVVTRQMDDDYYEARTANWKGLAMLQTNRAHEAEQNFLHALKITTDEICLLESQWGLLLSYQAQGEAVKAYDTAVSLSNTPSFANLPMMVTETLLPYQIYYNCWQVLSSVAPRQADKVLQTASNHIRDRLQRIESPGWKTAYLQEATLQGKLPVNS